MPVAFRFRPVRFCQIRRVRMNPLRSAREPPRAGFDCNVETGFQWGSFGNRSIRAWGAGRNRVDASRSGVARASRSAGRRHQRRQGPAGYIRNIQRAISARSLFWSEVRPYRTGKPARCSACLWRIVISPSHNGVQHCYIPIFMLLIPNALLIWRGTGIKS
jgi:hypothetical protein